jgi:two-component system, OmpR family, phosphate regulon sensor histidine kinase PhoR
MAAIGFLDPVRSAPATSRGAWHIGRATSGEADVANSDSAATLPAMAGHDLRQPLQVISSAHEVLDVMLCSVEQRHKLVQAVDATARLTRMLGQLVEALQLREGFVLPVLVGPVLAYVAAEFDEPARCKEITLEVTSTGGAALSHPLLLTSILRNRIRNAIDYTPRGGSVFVSSHRRGPDLCIYVRDTGIGIRPDALATIFAAFQRSEGGRAGGLGLGLFIEKRAADLLAHRIEVRSAKGHGSVFTIKTRACSTRPRAPISQLPRSDRPLTRPIVRETFAGNSGTGGRDAAARPLRPTPLWTVWLGPTKRETHRVSSWKRWANSPRQKQVNDPRRYPRARRRRQPN